MFDKDMNNAQEPKSKLLLSVQKTIDFQNQRGDKFQKIGALTGITIDNYD